jgi:Laminin EGF domain
MRTRLLTLGLFVGLFAACGGGDNNGATVTCGSLTCKVNEVCSMSSTAPVCACKPGYIGSSCTSCAPGYQSLNGVCILAPIDCSRTNACASHGTCTNNTCTCNAGYTGSACESCAEGYQDNDKNGTCLANCANPTTTVTCNAPQTCADTSGRAICSCPAGSTGSSCTTCLNGYTRQMNGTCIQCPANTTGEACADCVTNFRKLADGTCAACPMFTTGLNCESCVTGYAKDPATGQCIKSCTTNSQCGTRGFCDTSLPVPNCTCQPGYTGATCADCAPGYTRDAANQCILAGIPGGTTLIGAGVIAGVTALLAIDPAGNTATPIRTLPSSVTQIAADTESKVLYALDSTWVKKLDLATGALTAVATLASTTNLTWGPGGLFSIPSVSPYLLKRINVTTGGIADLGSTALSSVQSVAFDGASGALIAARWATSSPELHRVSASDGAATPMGTITYDPEALPPSNSRIGLAVDSSTGFVYAATAVGRTPTALFTKHCTQVAAGVGLTGYDSAAFSAMEYPAGGIGVGLIKVLGSQNASGKEIIAYASNASAGTTAATIRIDTTNPDAFVCLMTRDENLKIVLGASAKFAGIVFTGNRPRLAMEIEGVREVTMPMVHIAVSSDVNFDSTVKAYAIDKVYTTAEWNQKKLPLVTSLWSSDTSAPTRLVQLDLATNKPARVLSFPGVELQNLLTSCKP